MRGVAMFFPSVGFVPVDFGFVARGEEERDRLLVLQLTRDVPLPPIPASEVHLDDVRQPQAVGFGDWAQQDGTVYRRGVQRRLTPNLAQRLCTHDLCWDAEQAGSIAASINNSGGPIIERRPHGYQVVGTMRRQRNDIPTRPGHDVIAASAVSRNRAGALYRTIYNVFGEVERPLGPPPVVWHEFELNGQPHAEEGSSTPAGLLPFGVPPGTTMVHATLSAARQWVGRLQLQMRLLPGTPAALGAGTMAMILDNLARDPVSTGEFLARSLPVEAIDHVMVAIAPTVPLAGPVRVQLCLRFVDAGQRLLGTVSAPGLPQAALTPP